MTAFLEPREVDGVREAEEVREGGGARFVTRAKKARSDFMGGQGRVPRRPMPREGVVATMRVSGGKGRAGGIGEAVGGGLDMVL